MSRNQKLLSLILGRMSHLRVSILLRKQAKNRIIGDGIVFLKKYTRYHVQSRLASRQKPLAYAVQHSCFKQFQSIIFDMRALTIYYGFCKHYTADIHNFRTHLRSVKHNLKDICLQVFPVVKTCAD